MNNTDMLDVGLDHLKVSCYSGSEYAERPKSFRWQGKTRQVQEVEQTWREPGEKHFRVRTADNETFELCYSEPNDEWGVMPYG